MKALTYTLLLSAVLVGCVILLLSIDEQNGVPTGPTKPSLVLSGKPVPQTKFDVGGMKAAAAGEIFETGLELLDLWRFQEATRAFEAAAAKDTNSVDVFAKLIECYSHPLVCREDEARASWMLARKLAGGVSPADTLFVAALGDLYLKVNYEEAIERFELLAENPERKEDVLYCLASAFFQLGKPAESERYLKMLLEIDESSGKARTLLVRCAALRGDLAEAEALAKDLAALYAEEPYPYVLLSYVELLLGKINEAFSFCNNALLIDPTCIPAILNKGNLYAMQGEYEAARATYEKLLLFNDPVLNSLGFESIAFVDFLRGRFDDGADMMDEAIRNAMLVGSVRRGLYYAYRLVDYLCQLGRGDKAEEVVERWFNGFGEIPQQIGNVKLDIFNGNLTNARRVLGQTAVNREWISWMRMLGMDRGKVAALIQIKDGQYRKALEHLEQSCREGVMEEACFYLKGYAAFESGNAELAETSFEEVLAHPRGLEFPYHRDPVLFVQTYFYLAEVGIASGNQEDALKHYEVFVGFWGGADWEMQAVSRAREKLDTLSEVLSNGQ